VYKREKPYKNKAFRRLLVSIIYLTLSATADTDSVVVTVVDVAESVAIVVVSVDIVVVVESVVVSSALGLLWQAANVSMLPTKRRAKTFFICYGR
jgi:hypothetical protein